MRRLIFADVHANLPAFEAILEAAGYWDEAWFLGDIVGCGPNPKQCMKLLRDIDPICIAGNHDIQIRKLKSGSRGFYKWDGWTRSCLDDEDVAFLHTMSPIYSHEEEGQITTLMHSPSNSTYLHPKISAQEMAKVFYGFKGDRFLCGHSHHLIERYWQGKDYVCVRAVGQPRDADPCAGYSIEEDGVLKHFRVEYDVDRLLLDLSKIGLDPQFLSRWMNFTRTGYDHEWSRMD